MLAACAGEFVAVSILVAFFQGMGRVYSMDCSSKTLTHFTGNPSISYHILGLRNCSDGLKNIAYFSVLYFEKI